MPLLFGLDDPLNLDGNGVHGLLTDGLQHILKYVNMKV